MLFGNCVRQRGRRSGKEERGAGEGVEAWIGRHQRKRNCSGSPRFPGVSLGGQEVMQRRGVCGGIRRREGLFCVIAALIVITSRRRCLFC